MKRFLYLDNYRGFSDTIVPILDVNFMVGENSTGKTSLLKMLKMMSTPELLMGLAAYGKPAEVLFGHFNEMVSIHAKDRSYFRLGSIDELPEGPRPRGAPWARAILITYKEIDGMPRVSKFTFAQSQAEVSLRFENEKVFVKFSEYTQAATIESLRLSFARWKVEHSADSSGWEELQIPKGFPSGGPIPIYMALHFATGSSTKIGPIFFGEEGQFVFIAPIRTQPLRTYDEPNTPFSSEGDHTPYVIRRLSTSSDSDKFNAFMKHVGKSSGLFENVDIRRHGDSSDAPFEVDAFLDGKAVNLSWMGYGVSQSLPILVELFDRKGDCTFAIQQPEVHLHPRAQAALGDLFFDVAARRGKKFIIETHSDFTIDRFRLNYRQNAKKKKDSIQVPKSQILFFERKNSCNTVTPLGINNEGNLPSDQPRGYREFFINEGTRLLEL